MFKRLLLIILVIFSIWLQVVFAQQRREKRSVSNKRGTSQEGIRRGAGQFLRVEELNKSLNLSEEQRVQIQEILLEAREQISSIKKTSEENIKTIDKDAIEDINLLLSSDQQEKWKNYLEKNMKERAVSELQPRIEGVSREEIVETDINGAGDEEVESEEE